MAIILMTGWEDNTALAVSGTVDTSTTVVRSGKYSIIANPVTTAVGSVNMNGHSSTGAWQDLVAATIYVQFWFRYGIKPASALERMFDVLTGADSVKVGLNLKSDGKIEMIDAVAGVLGTSTAVLQPDTWYKIEVKCGTSATVGAYELKINGTSQFSGTGNTHASNTAKLRFGKSVNTNGQTVEFYYDDIIASDSAYVSGDVSIEPLIPTANGSTMSFTAGTGASNYTQVDEVGSADVADYVQCPTTGAPNVGLFAMTDSANAGVSGTIIALLAQINARENTSVTSSFALRVKSGATNSDGGTVNITTSNTARKIIKETDPNTSAAWTTSGIDAVEIGGVEANAVAIRISWVMAQVAFVPASAHKNINGKNYPQIKTRNGLAILSNKTIKGLA